MALRAQEHVHYLSVLINHHFILILADSFPDSYMPGYQETFGMKANVEVVPASLGTRKHSYDPKR